MANELEGKVALVTGGTRGIGLAIARRFAAAGARGVVVGVDPQQPQELARQIGRPDTWLVLGEDLADADAAERIVARTAEAFGRIDVLVNNAGVVGKCDFWGMGADDWDRVMAVNLRAAFLCARAAALQMRAAGRGGAIVNMASVAGQLGGVATGPEYVASKAALVGLTRSLARHGAPFGVRANCIAPADIETDMVSGWDAATRERLVGMTPMGRFGQADEVARCALFLASDASAYVTGHTLNVNGGLYMG